MKNQILKRYEWKPQKNIIISELALCMPAISKLMCDSYAGGGYSILWDAQRMIEDLPVKARRHFKCKRKHLTKRPL